MSQGAVKVVELGGDAKLEPKGYRRSIPFILSNVFFERIVSGGVFAILALFIHQKLHFDSDTSTALFHTGELILHFCTIVTAIVADSWLGLYKTITYCTLLSALGTGILAILSIEVDPVVVFSMIGMLLYVLAASGIRSNQIVFGSFQFKLPEQDSQLNNYFSVMYFCLNCGMLIGQVLLPILRNDVKCFSSEDCFPLAFGVATAFLVLMLVVFWCGRPFYTHEKPTGKACENGFVKLCGCCLTAVKQRFFAKKFDPQDHWLDYAIDKYGQTQVNEMKKAVNVLTLFLSFPVFYALHGQINSRWVFQATQMDGDVGFYTIKADQMAMTATLFTIILIPFFEKFGYLLLAKFGIKTSLDKMALGFVISAISFLMAAAVEYKIKTESISMLWMLPQFLMIAMSEILIWVSSLSFAYAQVPNMKSVITAYMYFLIGVSDVILITVSGSHMFDLQLHEFIFYVGLMIINTVCFMIGARKYKSVEVK